MKIHSSESQNENPVDPIAEKLRAASVDQQHLAHDSSHFASRIRSKIENDMQSVQLAEQVSLDATLRSRRTWVPRVVAVLTLAVAILLFASMYLSRITPESNRTNAVAQFSDDSIDRFEDLTEGFTGDRPILAKVEAEKGLQLVNASLGQTIHSVESARTALRGLLQPLRSLHPQTKIDEQTVDRHPNRLFVVDDDQMVAVFTAKILGIRE